MYLSATGRPARPAAARGGDADEQHGPGQRRDADAAPLLRSGPAGRPGVPGLGGVLPAEMAPVADRLGRPGPGGLWHGLVPDPARRLAGAAGQPAMGAVPRQPSQAGPG